MKQESIFSTLGKQGTTVNANGLDFHIIESGPEDGQLLVFLHGFPEFWYSWRYQIPWFAEKGFRVLVPDQRGYNLSAKPGRIADYRLDKLAEDVIAIMDSYGREKAHIVGHDWGGAVAWWLAMNHPEKLEKVAFLNMPHPLVLLRHIKTNPRQRERSKYFFMFQFPFLPEYRLKKNNWEMARKVLQNSSRDGTFTDEDLQFYIDAWAQPKAIRSMINWYRAMLRKRPARPATVRVQAPSLILWGKQDLFLGKELAAESARLCDEVKVEFLTEATHWLQHEEPEKVNDLLYDFLASPEDKHKKTR